MAVSIVLGADVGGTKTELALAAVEGGRLRVLSQRAYASQDYPGLDPIISDFIAGEKAALPPGAPVDAACFAVAGPVAQQATRLTNLGWQVSATDLSAKHGFRRAVLINDFLAAGYGSVRLDDSRIETLQPGSPPEHAARVIVGAGTGLGCGFLTWSGDRYVVQPSESGHADFAPVDEMQDRLLVYLRRNFGRVSYERIVSGPGLMRIFAFLQDSGFGMPSKPLLDATKRRDDPAEAIAEFAVSKLDPLAVRALDLFVAVYGSFAGNMALGGLALGGVYVAGGIAPKIVGKLRDGAFVRAFSDKGRFGDMLKGIPVRVVMDPQVGLRGALDIACRAALTA